MIEIRTLTSLPLPARVFYRVDYNVPLDGARVSDATRIEETLPTLRRLRDAGCAVVIASHLGRPKGQRNPKDSLAYNNRGLAYRNKGETDAAINNYDQAILISPDFALAYYNRGNAEFWLGEKNPDPAKRTETWQKALNDYELSMKLNPQDPDAKFNHEFVKKKLEELKQQQQQDKSKPRNIEPSEEARKAKAAADEAVRRRDYAKALDVMTKQLEHDETTQYYADYIQRLKEVNGVQSNTNP